MSGDTVIIAGIVCVAMIGSFLWGYREGVRYCVRQMKPLSEMAKQMVDDLRKRRP